jgi:hypothetical protein
VTAPGHGVELAAPTMEVAVARGATGPAGARRGRPAGGEPDDAGGLVEKKLPEVK